LDAASKVNRKNLVEQFKWSLELILELTSPETELPLKLMSCKLDCFARVNAFLTLLKKRGGDQNVVDEIKSNYYFQNSFATFDDFRSSLESQQLVPAVVEALNTAKSMDQDVLTFYMPLSAVTTTSVNGVNSTDSRFLIRVLKVKSSKLKEHNYQRLARVVAARAQLIQSKWQQVYPRLTSVDGNSAVSPTILSVARALAVTSMGAHGATVAALAGNPPTSNTSNDANEEED
jgi:hypothetical protein